MRFGPEEQAFLDRVADFSGRQLEQAARQWQSPADIDQSLFQQAANIGMTRLQIPQEAGGLGVSFACKSRMCEMLAQTDFGFALSVVNSHNAAHRLVQSMKLDQATPHLTPIFEGQHRACTALTEPDAGSDVVAMNTMATKQADGWTINGVKTWIVNALHAGLAILYAQTKTPGDASGIAAFMVDLNREGVSRRDGVSMTGQHAIGTGSLVFENYKALAHECLIPAGNAFKSILAEINGARIYVAAMCCGMVKAALDEAAQFGNQRQTFGTKLANHQGWRWTIGKASTELACVRALLTKAEDAHQANKDTQEVAAQVKLAATDMASRQIPALMQAMGAVGLSQSSLFSRHLLASRIAPLVDGSSEILLDRISNIALKRAAQTGPQPV